MTERITIHFEGQEVGIEYHPETSEAEARDALRAYELGLHALTLQAIRYRQLTGLPVPAVLTDLANAHTFRELL